MPLPILNLDDTQFQTMVSDALTAIPRYSPEWTDYNLHDPGITFIDLFAWIAEMQQYYLNRIRNDNYLRFLSLLGVQPANVTPAVASFVPNTSALTAPSIPQGTKISNGSVVFETTEALQVVQAILQMVVTISSAGTRDNSTANTNAGITFMAFGDNAETGSALYLGFSPPASGPPPPFTASDPIALTIFLYENYPVPRGSHGNEPVNIIPSAQIVWEYYRSDATWAPLNVVTDETVMLSLSGRVIFTAPGDMGSETLLPSNTTPYFWIRARVASQGYELPPRLNQILLNTVKTAQTNTLSEVTSYSSSGAASQTIQVDTFLTQQGDVEVQVEQSPGLWQRWLPQNNLTSTSKLNYTFKNGTITFGNGTQGQIPPEDTGNIRLIACPPGSETGRFIGQGNGLPNQQFPIAQTGVVPGTLLLQTSTAPGDPNPKNPGYTPSIWQDWIPVDNFDAAGPGDYQFVYDSVNNVVLFGDGVNGATPPACGSRNVRWIEMQLTQGSQGNIAATTTTSTAFTSPAPSGSSSSQNITWSSVGAATGGADPETLAAAELRARRDLNTPYRLVTISDFEYVAINTPGLRVSRAQAIPLYDPTPGATGQNTVTVVVVPYSTASQPTPSSGFLQTVCNHLMMHRLVTTKVLAVAPQYVTVTVTATVSLQAGAQSTTVQQAALTALQQFLNPLTGGPDGQGWPFGRWVYISDIAQVLDDVAGVSCVQTLSLSASGSGVAVVTGGDISIPAESLVVSGNHSITVATTSGVCPPNGGSS
jgi:Baseplate J-like protein